MSLVHFTLGSYRLITDACCSTPHADLSACTQLAVERFGKQTAELLSTRFELATKQVKALLAGLPFQGQAERLMKAVSDDAAARGCALVLPSRCRRCPHQLHAYLAHWVSHRMYNSTAAHPWCPL